MRGSYKLGTAFGIPIYLHWTFLVFAVWAVWLGHLPVGVLAVIFGCVLLHELGHSLVARRFGVRVADITFWPLGGMARMSDIPEVARTEGLIAIAGPAVNFALAAVTVVAIALVGAFLDLPGLVQMLGWFVSVNLVLGIFNLLPAFPMDGGRVLRSWFARDTDWVQATERAVKVGRWMALAMAITPFLLAILFPGRVTGLTMLPLIALFIWYAGGRERIAVRLRHGLPPFEGMVFQTTGAPPRPTAVEWREPAHEPAHAAPPGQTGEARRPTVWDQVPASEGAHRGFDESDVRALERFHGRLRRGSGDAGSGD